MSQNPTSSGTPAPFASKLLILKNLLKQNTDAGISEEDLNAITTAQEADELIAYLKPKENAAPVKTDEKKVKFAKLNAGTPAPELPNPEENPQAGRFNGALNERMNALHYKWGEHNTYNKGARVMMRFNERTGDMEVF